MIVVVVKINPNIDLSETLAIKSDDYSSIHWNDISIKHLHETIFEVQISSR